MSTEKAFLEKEGEAFSSCTPADIEVNVTSTTSPTVTSQLTVTNSCLLFPMQHMKLVFRYSSWIPVDLSSSPIE